MRIRLLAALAVVALATPALAYIEALKSLKGLYAETDVIAKGVIDAVSTEKKVMIVKVGKTLKGKTSYERIKINLGAADGWHGDATVRHAVVGAPVAVFYHKAENSDKAGIGMIYVNRFFLTVQPDDEMWRLLRIELAMNKVFAGTVDELVDLSAKVLSGRSKPPASNDDYKPYTKELLDALPLPPKEGEKWAEFDAAKAFKAQ
ncbi:MAG TPA: hypothetical protein VG457_19885 [Planctomycetota bacterium]|nr:hypothetical protein [Planctomycetota bacterium]